MKFSHQEREKREADFFHKVDQGMENLKYFRKIYKKLLTDKQE
jgi:hypothetical protein